MHTERLPTEIFSAIILRVQGFYFSILFLKMFYGFFSRRLMTRKVNEQQDCFALFFSLKFHQH